LRVGRVSVATSRLVAGSAIQRQLNDVAKWRGRSNGYIDVLSLK
jgi:hypothetical protein